VAAGESVTVYGDDMSPGVPGLLHLLTADGELLVGRADIGPDGHLIAAIQVPADLPPRVYELRLTDDLGLTFSTFITVVGAAAEGEPALALRFLAVAGAMLAIGMLAWAIWPRSSRRPRRPVPP
jgi:hypothetical protein